MFRHLTGLIVATGLAMTTVPLTSAPANAQARVQIGAGGYYASGERDRTYRHPGDRRYNNGYYNGNDGYDGYRYPRHRRYRDQRSADLVVGLGLGLLGGLIAAPPSRTYYRGAAPAYRAASPVGNFCHVHRYKVRGMSFHRDVRCWQHQNWRNPSIDYVR